MAVARAFDPHPACFLEGAGHVWLAMRESVDEHLREESEPAQVASTLCVGEAVGMTWPASRPRSRLLLRNEASFDQETEMPPNRVDVQSETLGKNMRIERLA